ncbi:hypothetical protein J3367_15990 [Aurantimonas sp. NFXS3]
MGGVDQGWNTRREKLIAAAHQANVATDALIRAVGEGGDLDEETLEKLADAAKILIEVELMVGDPSGETGHLHAALCKFLDGWAA